MISSMERKHKFIEETEETLGLARLLRSMEFKVMDPVCPEYDTPWCGKKIRLEEMSQHLVSCKYLEYKESQRKTILYGI